MSDTKRWRVLVVDDLPRWGEIIRDMSSVLNCKVHVATNLRAAVRELAQWQPHLILLDLHMPWESWDPLPQFSQKYPPSQKTLAFCDQVTSEPSLKHILVVMVSVENQIVHQEQAAKAGAHTFYTKGEFSVDYLQGLLTQLESINTPETG